MNFGTAKVATVVQKADGGAKVSETTSSKQGYGAVGGGSGRANLDFGYKNENFSSYWE